MLHLSWVLPNIFVTKHQHYARWIAYYPLELRNVKSEKPEVMEDLMKGAFTINRPRYIFAGVPVDMALDQRINTHAKTRLKGSIAYVDTTSAANSEE